MVKHLTLLSHSCSRADLHLSAPELRSVCSMTWASCSHTWADGPQRVRDRILDCHSSLPGRAPCLFHLASYCSDLAVRLSGANAGVQELHPPHHGLTNSNGSLAHDMCINQAWKGSSKGDPNVGDLS